MKCIFTIFTLIVFTISVSNSLAQTNWTKYQGNPVLTPISYYACFAPYVLKHGDTLKMWYTKGSYGIYNIYYAYSTNELNWLILPNPVLSVGPTGSWDSKRVSHPKILLVNTTYHMWFDGTDDETNLCYQLGYATSPDGIVWTKHDDPSTTNPPYAQSDPVLPLGPPGSWESTTGAGHSHFFDGDTFHMWYAACNNPTFLFSCMGYAKSPDGINWVKDSRNPIFTGTAGNWDSLGVLAPCVIIDSSGYKMWYQNYDLFHTRIGYATSSNGIDWVPLTAPILDVGDPGTWDDNHVTNPHVLLDNNIYKMWYTGSDMGTPNYGSCIGFGTDSTLVGITYNSLSELPLGYLLLQNYPNPFNPTTTIEFELPKTSQVTLKVYNILGEEVATLVSDRLSTGSYSYEWNASQLANGVYLYRLQAGDHVETRKMVLMR
jgi:predicted GH43/DUF377 family glycosyl hydrolase